MNRGIRTTAVYILNDFKHVHNKTYFDYSTSTREDLRAADLIIKNIKLIKNFQANVFSDHNFVKSFSVTSSRIDIIETDISTSSTRTVVVKFSISKIVFVTSRKTSQAEKID